VQALDCYQIKGAKVRVEPITIHTADRHIRYTSVAIGNRERHVRKASHHGSKEQ